MKKITKRLQTLVKDRKTPMVVIKQGSIKPVRKNTTSSNYESYSYYSYNT